MGKTARARWREWAATREPELPGRPPEHIGLHIARVGGIDATVVTDVEARTVMDVLPGVAAADVAGWYGASPPCRSASPTRDP